MKTIIASFTIATAVSASAQNKVNPVQLNINPNQAIFLNVSNVSQGNFNWNNEANDNNIQQRSQRATHLFTKANINIKQADKVPVQQKKAVPQLDRGRGNRANDDNINDIQPLPRLNVMNNVDENVNPPAQQAVQQAEPLALNIDLPQIKMPVIKFSSGGGSTYSDSGNHWKRDFKRKLFLSKRKFSRLFAHSKKHKINAVSCFNWSNG